MEKNVETRMSAARQKQDHPTQNAGDGEHGLSILWFAADSSTPINIVRFLPQMPKHNAKSNRLYFEAETPGAVHEKKPFCPPAVGELRVVLRGEPVYKISYTIPAPRSGRPGLGADAAEWVQLNEPKSEYVVQLKLAPLAPETPQQAWVLARLLVYVPDALALLGLWAAREPDPVPKSWRPGEPVTIDAILGL